MKVITANMKVVLDMADVRMIVGDYIAERFEGFSSSSPKVSFIEKYADGSGEQECSHVIDRVEVTQE